MYDDDDDVNDDDDDDDDDYAVADDDNTNSQQTPRMKAASEVMPSILYLLRRFQHHFGPMKRKNMRMMTISIFIT